MHRKILFPILLLSLFVPLRAQTDLISAGNSSLSPSGFISVSVGQVARLYSADALYYDGQGLQQPYCPTRYDTVVASACQHLPFSNADFNLPADSTATPGMHFFHRLYLTAEECDSIVVLALTVNPVADISVSATACDSLSWTDTLLTASGAYSRHGLTAQGCDSTTTLTLTLRHSSSDAISDQAYLQYQWRGSTYTESGTYSDTLRAANAEGCDSITTLSLAVITDATIPYIYCFSRRVMIVDHYPYGEDSTRVDYRAYRWYHDGELLPLATLDRYFDLRDGAYRYLEGCYYVEVPVDNAGRFWVHSNTVCVGGATDDLRQPSLSAYPNPSAAFSDITATVADAPQGSTLALHDHYGRPLYSAPAANGTTILPISLTTGIYTLTLQTPDNQKITQKMIVR